MRFRRCGRFQEYTNRVSGVTPQTTLFVDGTAGRAVRGKARIVAAFGQGLNALIVQAKVENGIHHARHGKFCAGANAYQQRVLPRAQFLSLQLLQLGERFVHLLVYGLRHRSLAHVFATSFGLNRKSRRDGQSGVGHLGQARAFAAEVVLHLAVAVGFAAAKREDVLCGCILFGGRQAGFRESLCRHNECSSFIVSILWILCLRSRSRRNRQ